MPCAWFVYDLGGRLLPQLDAHRRRRRRGGAGGACDGGSYRRGCNQLHFLAASGVSTIRIARVRCSLVKDMLALFDVGHILDRRVNARRDIFFFALNMVNKKMLSLLRCGARQLAG